MLQTLEAVMIMWGAGLIGITVFFVYQIFLKK